MIIIGLTGSIGMGKSTTAAIFRDMQVPVFDADAEVHALQAPGGAALDPIEAAFPGVVKDGVLDREALGARVFGDQEALKKLEAIVHPLVGETRTRFFAEAEASGAKMVVLDIPLLFETGMNKGMHKVVVVSTSDDIQRERVLARPGMTAQKFEEIKAMQVPDQVKRQAADFVIDSSHGIDAAREQVAHVVAELSQ